ncbi:MAG: alpha-glucosidase MalA [Metallosphaera sp.]
MITVLEQSGTYKVKINEPITPVDFDFNGLPSSKKVEDLGISIQEDEEINVVKKLGLRDHVIGLGEKAFELDRRRRKFVMYNVDAGAFNKYSDPLYVNIPFIIIANQESARGYFFNSASKLIFDIGQGNYDEIRITIPEDGAEIFVFEGPKIESVLERYSKLTGLPYLPPSWAFGYMISRFSYYPQERIVELIDSLNREGFPVSAVFLDIDFMDAFKLFTWHPERFRDPDKFIKEVHSRGAKIITIVDHSVRVDQSYSVFRSGLGLYCETDRGDLFVGKLWPGNCVYPDFFMAETREWWANLIKEWISSGVDGIWLDMNEPTDFTKLFQVREVIKPPLSFKENPELYVFPGGVVHKLRGKVVRHERVRNAYPLYEAMATYQGMKGAGKEPFILSRSGYAGIQRYAGIWTGDNTSSWDQLKLQIQLVLGLSISGVPYVGMDIGGFQGREFPEIDNSPELLVRHFQIAMFFPLFRTHKNKDGIDTEPIYLPSLYKEKVRSVFKVRHRFLPYLYSLAKESHATGHPILRPLFYEFQDDEDSYRIDDEYMIGKFLLYAPLVTKEESRTAYLPREKWVDFWTGEELSGWVRTENELPIYVREGSIIPLSNSDLLVCGRPHIPFDGISIEDDELKFETPRYLNSLIINGKSGWVTISVGKEVKSVNLETLGQ